MYISIEFQVFKTLPRFYFGNFIVLQGKYVVPPKPKRESQRTLIFEALKQKPENQNLNKTALNQIYSKLSEEEKSQMVDYEKIQKEFQEQLKQWRTLYDFPKRPMNIVVGKLSYLQENLPEAKKLENETQPQYISRLHQLMKQKEDFFKQHENILKLKLENINKQREEKINKYKEEFEMPQNMTLPNIYFKKVGGDIATAMSKFKSITNEEKEQLQQELEVFQQERQKKLERLASKYNTPVEEFAKLVRKQKKEQKKEQKKNETQ